MKSLLLVIILCCICSAKVPGGKYLPSEGRINALFIFVQFPDDKYEPEPCNWKLNQAPDYMNSFADSVVTNKGQNANANVSRYFEDMSLGKFHLTGKSVFIITPHERQWYFDNKKTRYFINTEVIEKADTLLDFSAYDNWRRIGEYSFEEAADDTSDMIFIIYRNVANDLPDSMKGRVENQFGLVPGGEASLGYGPPVKVDGGIRTVLMGYPGSGVNIKAKLDTPPVSGCAHEFGHYLFGGNEAHFSTGLFGLMSAWGYTQRSVMMNGWERLQLGWANLIEAGPDKKVYKNLKLRDYITTGDLIKINIPGSKEYFLLENHQMINKLWDVPDQSRENVKGIYLLQQSGNSGSTVKLICADGKWIWEVKEKTPNPYGGKDSLPVFRRVKADPVNGNFDSDMIPYHYKGGYTQDVIHFQRKTANGKLIEQAVFRGDGGDCFNLQRNIFSERTNPRPLLSNKKPAPVSFHIKSAKKEKDGSRSYILDINIK